VTIWTDSRADGGPLSSVDWLIGIDTAAERPASRVAPPAWKRHVVLMLGLIGLAVILLLAALLATSPRIDAQWRVGPGGLYEMSASRDPKLSRMAGQSLRGLLDAQGRLLVVDALLLQRPLRWVVDEDDRRRHHAMHMGLAEAMQGPDVTLLFDNGAQVRVAPMARGFRDLGGMFWLMSLLALLPLLIGWTVVLTRPQERNALFCLMTQAQALGLLLIAVESVPDIVPPALLTMVPALPRMMLDVCTAAAIAHTTAINPQRVPGARPLALAMWAVAGVFLLYAWAAEPAHLWWSAQVLLLGYGAVALAVLSWSYRKLPHPFGLVLRRFGVLSLVSVLALTAALAISGAGTDDEHNIASIASIVWRVFFTGLLVLLPFLSRTQHVLREFTMLAGVALFAVAVDLLFVTLFEVGAFASLSLALFAALAAYVAVRQRTLQRLTRARVHTVERMFERLYEIARAMELHPTRTAALVATLLREVFEPVEAVTTDRRAGHARVLLDGAALLVPVPPLTEASDPHMLVLRFAGRGTRLFTNEDARLTDRLLEQLRRAIHFDRAVEQGRMEERIRLAQDLHDDIGARLLTLMYQAPTQDMENYLRHTLQDLKTLTRGLAAQGHRLSEAAAEWKADIAQRVEAVPMELHWLFEADDDPTLGVVQWSSLTRILRELVSNAIAHSMASRIDIRVSLLAGAMTIRFSDNGIGREPERWSHGLGLGGIRKRVKLLRGEVEWSEHAPHGIGCVVTVRELASAH
jgi:signal transduction histidine kinase